MTQCTLKDLEEYDPNKFLKKAVHSGPRSTVALLHLMPGQEVPTHSHAGIEIMLVPQKGEALLTIDENKVVVLKPGLFFSEIGDGHTFSIKNNGDQAFQMLAVQVRN
jgi:quercetin dioxygenase-like cupin family protein